MLRSAVVLGASVLTLGLAMSLAAANQVPVEKPPPLLKKKAPALDAAWANQLTTRHPAKVTVPDIKKVEPSPNFAAIKRMTLEQKAVALQTAPAQVTGPIKLSARAPFHDERHYLDIESGEGKVFLRTKGNYAYFLGPDAVFASVHIRPRMNVAFQAEPGRRYLLECAIDVAGTETGTITAAAAGAMYSVSSSERATLLFRHDGGATAEQVIVEIAGDRPWYFDGCELSWTGP